MHWQNYKRCFRGSAKQNFLPYPTMVGKFLENTLEILSVDFTIQSWYFCKLPERIRVKISKFLFLPLSGKVSCLQPATSQNHEFLCSCFPRFLTTGVEHLFCRAGLHRCFGVLWWAAYHTIHLFLAANIPGISTSPFYNYFHISVLQ